MVQVYNRDLSINNGYSLNHNNFTKKNMYWKKIHFIIQKNYRHYFIKTRCTFLITTFHTLPECCDGGPMVKRRT